jgi:hypothetical protein
MDNNLVQQTTGAILSIINILVPLAGAYVALYKAGVVDFIKSKIGLINDAETRTVVENAFDKVEELIEDAIVSAESTTKKELLPLIEEGKVSKDSLKQIGVDVKNNVKNQLSDELVEALKSEIKDVEGYINTKVESQLAKLKLDPDSPVQKTTVQEPEKPVVDTTQLENENTQLKIDKDNLSQQNVALQSNVESLTQNVSDLSAQLEQTKNANVELQNKFSQIASAIQL